MLRDYQAKALSEIRKLYSKGVKKVLFVCPTGGGKTTVFGEALKGVYQRGGRAIMVVRGRKLVDQASRRLFREKVPHGVLMSGHWNFLPSERIQICSIDTLTARRGKMPWPEADLVVIDEAHLAISPGFRALAEHYQGRFFLPVTATPYVPTSLRHIADEIVSPVTMEDLINQGYLVPPVYFVPSWPDLSDVSVRKGEYVTSELEAIMGEKILVGDAVANWLKLSELRPSLYFCVSVEHSKQVALSFNARGIPAVHCDADTPEREREDAIRKLESGEIKVITNVGIFCTGVDIPKVSCIGMLRPTMSYNLYVQQAGRGTRPAENKKDFLLIDHAGNVKRHGFITETPEFSLDGKIKKFLPSKSPTICKECFAAFEGSTCPQCGWTMKQATRERGVIQTEGELVRLDGLTRIERRLSELTRTQKMRGYKKGWLYHKIKEEFGEDEADRLFPGYAERIERWKKSAL